MIKIKVSDSLRVGDLMPYRLDAIAALDGAGVALARRDRGRRSEHGGCGRCHTPTLLDGVGGGGGGRKECHACHSGKGDGRDAVEHC